ncbi:hypothetical protein D3C87_2167610 [compost metagenome]
MLRTGLLSQQRVDRPFHLNPQRTEPLGLADKITTAFTQFVHRLAITPLSLIQALP